MDDDKVFFGAIVSLFLVMTGHPILGFLLFILVV
jgi:hypothetical protein